MSRLVDVAFGVSPAIAVFGFWLKENRQSRNDRKFVQKRRAW